MVSAYLRRGMAAGLFGRAIRRWDPFGGALGFQAVTLGTQLTFWTGLGLLFGMLCERATRMGATT